MSSKSSFCPVPFDQQPMNEYESLERSPLFYWSTKRNTKFVQQLLILSISFYFAGIIISLSLLNINKFSSWLFINSMIFSLSIIEIILVRLYLGWSYIFKRLASATIFYEESGWYDGQLWVKSAAILTKDRLIGIYQVQPILMRIKKIFLATSGILLIMLIVKTQVE